MDDRLRSICLAEGAFLRREALGLGYDQKTITRRVRSGAWTRIRHGAYTFPDLWKALDDRARHAVLVRASVKSARTTVVVSHESAVAEHTPRFWDLNLREVDLSRRDLRSGRREAGIRQHHGLLLPEDVIEHKGLLVTSAAKTCLDLSTVTDVEHALVVVEGMLHDGLTSLEELRARLAAGMEQCPHSLTTALVLRLADGRTESVGETRCRYLFWSQHLPEPELQHEVRTTSGDLIGRSDFAWEEFQLLGEFDGRVKYERLLQPGETAVDVVFREKRREQAMLEATGWRIIRLTWADLRTPARTAARIRELMELAKKDSRAG